MRKTNAQFNGEFYLERIAEIIMVFRLIWTPYKVRQRQILIFDKKNIKNLIVHVEVISLLKIPHPKDY